MKKFYCLFLSSFITVISYSQNDVKGNKEVYLGNKAYEKGDLKTAVNQYRQALKMNPNNLAALMNLGIAQSKMKEADASVKSFDNAINQSKDANLKSTLNYDKGTTLANSKKYEDAINAFKNTLRINPDDEEARENLQKAIDELKKQQQQNKQNQQNQDQKNQQQKQDNKQQQQNQNKQDQQKQQQQNQNQMSKQQAEQLLKALRDEEKETQKKLNQQKASGEVPPNGKDW